MIAAGLAAGVINAVVGSGSLITFPVLVATGYLPVVANVSNTVGLALGGISAAHGYRVELRGQCSRAFLLGIGSALGAVAGGALLLVLPSSVFEAVVPILIVIACLLMALRPSLPLARGRFGHRRIALLGVLAFAVGVYGGYFGAAQGVILLAGLRLLLPDRLQRLNGLKNVLGATANCVAAVQFALFADVAWVAAGLIAASSICGAQIGARYGRRVPDDMLRWAVVFVSLAVAAVLAVT